MRKVVIKEETAGKRLDVFATELLSSLSRAYVARLIDEGQILVNKAAAKPGYRLRAGDKVLINFDQNDLELIPDIDLPIIYEDSDVIVINKPVGIISHSRGRYWNEPSVASFVRQKTGQEGERAGIVHRLDRATSGVMICTKNQAAMKWLQAQFSKRKVKKNYIAIVSGHLEPNEAIIDMPIERNPKAPAKFRVGSNGKPSLTTYRVTGSIQEFDVVELEPQTGRTHQLRVHLTGQDHPIVGDTLYNGLEASRLMLHAKKLEITLPNGKRHGFEAPLPPEFENFLREKNE